MLFGDTLLNCFTPLLVAICSNPVKYADADLRCSAGVALCKYMLMSSDFADKHLRNGNVFSHFVLFFSHCVHGSQLNDNILEMDPSK